MLALLHQPVSCSNLLYGISHTLIVYWFSRLMFLLPPLLQNPISAAGLRFLGIGVYPQTAQFVLVVNPVMGGSLSFVEIKLTSTLSSEPNAGRSSCP